MDVRLNDIVPTKEEPYKDDLLDRAKCGMVLEQIVSTFSDGCVIALHGKWGTGKTTFVKMWMQDMHRQKGYEVLYYNAWESDFIPDPIIGLIAEFKKATSDSGKEKVEKLTKAVAKISFAMIPEILAQIAKYYTGVDWEKMVKEGAIESVNILNHCVDSYSEQQKSIEDFKGALCEYVSSLSSDKPIIYIIDELDRCNPAYAVKTLERIKHLFSVRNVVFVLAIDKEQLCHSIRGYYGSDLIDADDYLRRFIDIQYNLPVGNVENLVKYALKRFSFSDSLLKRNGNSNSLDAFTKYSILLYQLRKLSIRQLEKWLLYTRLVIDNTRRFNISVETILFLVFLRLFDTEFYNRFVIGDIDDQSCIEYLTKNFPDFLFDTESYPSRITYTVIAELIRSRYGNNDRTFKNNVLFEKGDFRINLSKTIDEKLLMDSFSFLNNVPSLDSITKLIELMDSIRIEDYKE